MSGPGDGKYTIVPAVSSNPTLKIGANSWGSSAVPVVLGGQDNVWTIRNMGNGAYTMVLEQRSSQASGNIVLVSMSPPSPWAITKQLEDAYSIEALTGERPNPAWMLAGSPEPGTRVMLSPFMGPRPNQLWKFVPA